MGPLDPETVPSCPQTGRGAGRCGIGAAGGVVELTLDLARRRSLLIAAVAVPLFSGCFPPVASFSKPGVSAEEYERDRYVCVRESRVRNLVGGEEATTLHGDERQREANRLFEACMIARGYKRVE